MNIIQATARIQELEKALAPIAALVERSGGLIQFTDSERVGIVTVQDAIKSSLILKGLDSKDQLTIADLRYAATVMKRRTIGIPRDEKQSG